MTKVFTASKTRIDFCGVWLWISRRTRVPNQLSVSARFCVRSCFELFRSSFGWHCCKWRTSFVMSIKHLWMTSSNFSVNVTAVFATKRVIISVCFVLISSFVMVSWSYLRSHLISDWVYRCVRVFVIECMSIIPCLISDWTLEIQHPTYLWMTETKIHVCIVKKHEIDTDNEKAVSWFIVITLCCRNPVIVL